MSPKTDFLRCPVCKSHLEQGFLDEPAYFDSMILSCTRCRRIFLSRNGIFSFMPGVKNHRMTARLQFFRAINLAFYTPLTNFMFRFCGGAKNARHEVLDRLEIKPGDKILETGVGTGDNYPFLTERAENLELYGLDNQYEMLRKCRSNLKKWNISSELYLGDAVDLPFRDNYFDVVFHLGAFNLFSDKRKAIREMIRVAKPGTLIVVADESQKAVSYFEILTGKLDKVTPPVDMVPETAGNIRFHSIWNELGYLVEFRKNPEEKKDTSRVYRAVADSSY